MSTMTISDLRTHRADTWEKAKAFLDERRDTTTGCLSAEDDQTYARMEADIDKLTNEIARAERAQRLDADLARATNAPLTSMPGQTGEESEPKTGRATASYKRAFWDAMRLNASPMEVRNALSEGVDSEGGYLVPDEFEHTLVQSLADQNIMRGLANVIQTTSGDRKIPVVSTHGSAGWLDEGKPYTESDETFSQITLSAFKLGTFLKISEELLGDSVFDVEAYLAAEFARRIGAAEEEAFLVAQLVTMDTRPQCGAGPSNSFDTGYELGFPAAADVWRLACCTAEYLARHYPAGVRRGGEPVGISRARIDAGSRQMMRVAPLPVDDTACYSFLQVGRRPSALLVNYKAFSKLGVKSLVVV